MFVQLTVLQKIMLDRGEETDSLTPEVEIILNTKMIERFDSASHTIIMISGERYECKATYVPALLKQLDVLYLKIHAEDGKS